MSDPGGPAPCHSFLGRHARRSPGVALANSCESRDTRLPACSLARLLALLLACLFASREGVLTLDLVVAIEAIQGH